MNQGESIMCWKRILWVVCIGVAVLAPSFAGDSAWAQVLPQGSITVSSGQDSAFGPDVTVFRDSEGKIFAAGVAYRSSGNPDPDDDGVVVTDVDTAGTPGATTLVVPGGSGASIAPNPDDASPATNGISALLMAERVDFPPNLPSERNLYASTRSADNTGWAIMKLLDFAADQDSGIVGAIKNLSNDILFGSTFANRDPGLGSRFLDGAQSTMTGMVPDAGTDADISFSTTMDGGATWTTPVAVNSDAFSDVAGDFSPDFLQLSDGSLLVVWEGFDSANVNDNIYFSRSTDLGATWSTRATIDPRFNDFGASDFSPHLKEIAPGKVIAVWMSRNFWQGASPAGSDDDIVYSISSDSGLTWSVPLLVNSNGLTDSDLDRNPSVASDGMGRIVVVWEGRNFITPGGSTGADTDIIVATSTDMGVTWSDPVPLNTDAVANTDSDSDPDVVPFVNGSWFCTWSRFDGVRSAGDILGVTFRVSSPGDTVYVDFAHAGVETGIQAEPFNTLGEGLTAVNPAGTIKIAPGSSPTEMPTINQVVTLENSTGLAPAVVGGTAP